MKKIKKIAAAITLFCYLAFSPISVLAFSYPSPTSAMNQILSNLGVDKSELKYQIKTFNVSRRKKQPPQVSLTFNPANPAPGMEVTAVATPMYFLNDEKDLYFTWYLKPAECLDVKDDDYTYKSKCDLNNDDKVNIEDHKIRAMRIIANNGFEYQNQPDNDDDGYKAIHGGNDQAGKNYYYYIHDTRKGDEYKLSQCLESPDNNEGCPRKEGHLFPHAPEQETGDGEFGKAEEKFWNTDPNDNDTADTGNGDEANVAGMGIKTFTWNYAYGDQVGVVVEGISVEPTQEKDSSYRIMWAMPKNECLVDTTSSAYPRTLPPEVTITPDTPPGKTTTVTVTRYEYIVSQSESTITVRIRTTTRTVVTNTATGEVIGTPTEVTTTTCPNYDPFEDDLLPIVNIFEEMTCVGEDEQRDVEIGLLDPYGDPIEEVQDLNNCLYKNFVNPYDGGGQAEKIDLSLSYLPKFPMNDQTEENMGDELVVNSSIINPRNAGYINYKWEVFASQENNPNNWGDPILKNDLPESTQTNGINIESLRFKLNFVKSVLAKYDVTNIEKFYLKVKLTVMEHVPAESASTESQNKTTRRDTAEVIVPITSTSERVKVYSSELSDNLKFKLGSEERCVNNNSTSSNIDIDPICDVIKDEVIGLKIENPKVRNRDKYTDFLWTLNGKPINYSECFFVGCEAEKQTNVIYFPVLEDPGFVYNINLSATNQETGEKLNLSRTFSVVDPEVKIGCANDDYCKNVLLGHYIDVDGKPWPDYSDTKLLSMIEYPVDLQATSNGSPVSSDKFTWSVDGETITKDNAAKLGYNIDTENGILTLQPKLTGEHYNVDIRGRYAPSQEMRKALNMYWGVGYGEFYEKGIHHAVDVKMVDYFPSSNNVVTQKSMPKKILATVYSAAPSYILFLVRIILTMLIMLFSARFILSFSPKTN